MMDAFFVCRCPIHTNQVSETKHKPIFGVDLMWADVEEDDMEQLSG